MDIRQLEYFIQIVKSGFNLSLASKELNISQPALSALITNFESSEKVILFTRSKGKLSGLTKTGENFYENAKLVIMAHKKMLSSLYKDANFFKGTIKIGIPPLVLSVVFSEILPQLILENPDITFEIIEKGAFELAKMLILKELDFAILLSPTHLDKNYITEYPLIKNELSCFMSSNNPLAQHQTIQLSDLKDQPLAFFDNNFMINHFLTTEFKKEKITPNIVIYSGSWDYLLLATKNTNLITILPNPINTLFPFTGIKKVPLAKPITWDVTLCQYKKPNNSHLENFFRQSIVKFFDKGV